MNLPRQYRLKSITSGVFCLLVFSVETVAQPPRPPETPPPTRLSIVVVRGEGSVNKIRQRAAADPVVRVDDQDQQPVSGASVVFSLPTEGATGKFGNGSKTLTVTTDKDGQAVAQGLRFNEVPGKIPIYVSAYFRGVVANITISVSTVAPPGTRVPKSAGREDGH